MPFEFPDGLTQSGRKAVGMAPNAVHDFPGARLVLEEVRVSVRDWVTTLKTQQETRTWHGGQSA
jgi:hypothetical protein